MRANKIARQPRAISFLGFYEMQSIYNGIFEIEKKILYGLSCEWDLVVNELNIKYYAKLKKPSFSIKKFSKTLAMYQPNVNEISFSEKFVMSHPWDSVRDVLLHEIAHQFDSSVYNNNGKPHGESFKKACEILNADPKASGDYKPLSDYLNEELFESDRILLKVKKLMALAKSKNRNEAESAMAKAHLLIEKYNIDLINSNEKRDYKTIFIGKPALRHFRESYYITRLLTDYYFVEGIWVSSFSVQKGKVGKVFEISGTSQNLKITSYVYDFVNRYIDRQWIEYKKDKKLNRYRKTDFAIGIIEGFRTKLEKKTDCNMTKSDERSLVNVTDMGLVDYYHKRYPRQRTVQRKSSSHNKTILEDGFTIGKKLVISKGIEENRKKQNKYLT